MLVLFTPIFPVPGTVRATYWVLREFCERVNDCTSRDTGCSACRGVETKYLIHSLFSNCRIDL